MRGTWRRRLILLLCGVWINAASGQSAGSQAAETFGCEPNPTGDPIGGGAGYRDIKTTGDFTVRTAAALLAALKKAQPGQVIFIPDGVEIDLAGYRDVVIPPGVTLAGTRGRDGSTGARIVMKEVRQDVFYQFETAGDDVRLTGLWFDGPGRGQREGYPMLIRTTHYGLEVDNCEISNWSYAAIVGQPGAANIRVHHNYIHHCNGAAHDGYGVSLDACDALVIANKFAYIRNHAVSGTGAPGTGYEAAYNLLLPPSGFFDMHGGIGRGDGTNIAGDWILIHHNTFPMEDPGFPKGSGCQVILTGYPSQGVELHHNWFAWSVTKSFYLGQGDRSRNILVFRNAHGAEKIIEE